MEILKRFFLIFVVLIFSNLEAVADNKGDQVVKNADDMNKKISYALGYNIVKNLTDGFELDQKFFIMGVKDKYAGNLQMSEDEIKTLLIAFQKKERQRRIDMMKNEARENKLKGAGFIEENKKKQDVVTLPSGLQYKIISKGNGPVPKADDTVECHYKGSLIDGTVFDSSYKRGKPATFQVGGVIKGWVEALQMMKVGSKWQLFIPSDLAYGDRGAGPLIKPGSTLIFEVELLGIVE